MATTGTAIIRVSIVGEGPVVTPAKCCVAQGATVVWVPDTTVKSASLRFAADCGSATLGDTPDKYGKKEFTFLETNGTADPTGLTVGLTSKSAFPYCLSANGGPEPYPAIIIKPTSGTRCPE